MTKKHLTKKLLLETKWIRQPQLDGVDITTDFKMPFHVVSYCRICDAQHTHSKIVDTNTGAWYFCRECAEIVEVQG